MLAPLGSLSSKFAFASFAEWVKRGLRERHLSAPQ